MILAETGTLPFGVAYEGRDQREYELRELLVSDTVAILEDEKIGPRAARSDAFFNVAMIARRLTRLGDIPAEQRTADLVMGMHQEDFNELAIAEKRLTEKRRSFRGADDTPPQAGAGAQKDGL